MKKGKIFVLVAGLSVMMTFPSRAGEWKSDSNGWWYLKNDGSYCKDGWEWIDGNNDGVAESYYFGTDGYILVNATTPDGYEVDHNGAWTVNEIVQLKEVGRTNTVTNNNSTSNQTPLFDFGIEGEHIKYTGYKIKQDYNGNNCLVLYYDYTNTSDEAKGAWLSDISIKAFQNGVECDSAFIWDENDESISNYSKDIMSGITINVATSFKLKDMSNITIQLEEIWNWTNPKSQTVELKLQ